MKNFKLIVSLSIFVIALFAFGNLASIVFAQDVVKDSALDINSGTNPDEFLGWTEGAVATITPQGESPFDYYHFGSVKADIQPDKVSYFPGEEINFKGTITNTNEYPILNSQLYIRILRNNKENHQQNGDYIIDEFFVLENIYLLAGEHRDINFKWNIPSTAIGGNYVLATYFMVNKAYNISGLSFTSDIYAGFTNFEIREESRESIFFDRNNTKFNGDSYLFAAFIPEVTSKDKVEIIVPLKNTYLISKDIEISYDLYYWDGLLESNKLKSSSEIIKLDSNSSKDIVYSLDNLDKSVYFLRLTAKSGQDKSIINIRFWAEDIPDVRINFAGLTKFPLLKDESAKAFVTFHGITPQQFDGHIELALKNKRGKILSSESFEGPISGDVSVKTLDFKTQKDINYLVVEAKLYDKANKLVDTASIVYDMKLFGAKSVSILNNVLTYIILGLIILAIIVVIYFAKKKRPPITAIPILLFLLIAAGFVGYFLYDNAVAQQNNCVNCSQDIGPYVLSSYSGGHVRASLDVDYDLSLYDVGRDRNLLDHDTVYPGASIELRFNKSASWNGIGGVWDTPFAYWTDSVFYSIFDNRWLALFLALPNQGRQAQDGVRYGQRTGWAPLFIQNPAVSSRSWGDVDYVGNNRYSVRPGASGQITIRANIAQTYFRQICIFPAPLYNSCTSMRALCSANDQQCNAHNQAPPMQLSIQAATKAWYLTLAAPPTFQVSILPATNNVLSTGSAQYQVTVRSVNGFSAPVNLSFSWTGLNGSPNGASYAFANNQPTITVTPSADSAITTMLTITTNNSPGRNHNFVVTGVSRSIAPQESNMAQLKIQDFDISVSPAVIMASNTGQARYTVDIERLNGFNSPVDLSFSWTGLSGPPNGASYAFANNRPTITVNPPANGPMQTTLTITTNNSPGGDYPFVVTGVSGSVTRTDNATLNIPMPVCSSFSADPSSIVCGEASTLRWNCSNIIGSCFIDPINPAGQRIGGLSPVGSYQASPSISTSYGLTCGGLQRNADIVVQQPSCSYFTASQTDANGSSTLRWDCSNIVGSCSIDQGIGGLTAGPQPYHYIGFHIVRPAVDTMYTLTCRACNNRELLRSVTVSANQPRLIDQDLTCSVLPRVVEINFPARFSVRVTSSNVRPPYTYQWAIATGTVVSGQGSDALRVRYDNPGQYQATTTVNGQASCSATVQVYRRGEIAPQ